jgi:hypothetical protein
MLCAGAGPGGHPSHLLHRRGAAPRLLVVSAVVAVVMVEIDPAAHLARLLSDEDWTKVSRYSGLPPDARPRIGMAIAAYRQSQAVIDARKTSAQIRDQLEGLRDDADALMKHLEAAIHNNADLYVALTFPRRPPKGWPPNTGAVPREVAEQRLRSALFELDRLVCWLGLARDRVPRGKPGAKRQAVPAYFLVNHLNEILERFTGKTITRSTKTTDTVDYVKTVCRIADPKIGDGTIIEAIKKEIKNYKPFGGISPDPAGVIPPPNLRDKRPSGRKSTKRNRMED